MNTLIDDTLRDLLEDTARRTTSMPREWVEAAHPQWAAGNVAGLWSEFLSTTQRADDAFIALLRGPEFTRLHAVAA